MRIAYIVLAHKNPSQLERLIKRLHTPEDSFVIHIDSKADKTVYQASVKALDKFKNVHFVTRRRKVFWGGFSQTQVMIDCLGECFEKKLEFDYVKLISGQDYPLSSTAQFKKILAASQNCSYLENFSLPHQPWIDNGEPDGGLNRVQFFYIRIAGREIQLPFPRKLPNYIPTFFAGSAYWCLTRECASYVHRFIQKNSRFVRFFRWVANSDELFFQTIIMNSDFSKKVIDDNLTYTDWLPHAMNPKLLTERDVDTILQSPCLFARKFDTQENPRVLDFLDAQYRLS